MRRLRPRNISLGRTHRAVPTCARPAPAEHKPDGRCPPEGEPIVAVQKFDTFGMDFTVVQPMAIAAGFPLDSTSTARFEAAL
jgi:hypothetical protein